MKKELDNLSNVQRQELAYILKAVERDWSSERAFYCSLDIRQSTWERFKNGSNLTITRKNWDKIISSLFNQYEFMLFRKAQELIQYNNSDNLEQVYIELKKQHAKYFIESGGKATVNPAEIIYKTEKKYVGTLLIVEDVLGNTITFRLNCSSKDVPSGKRNRLTWFREKFDKVVIDA